MHITCGAPHEDSNEENYSAQFLPPDPTKYLPQRAIRGAVELMHLLFSV